MSTPQAEHPTIVGPDIRRTSIEDNQREDSIYAEKQRRLLTEPLYTSWAGPPAEPSEPPRTFLAAANVGLFSSVNDPPMVPDMLLSADVSVHPDFQHERKHRTYVMWEMGKLPEVVIEIVSNRERDEFGKRKRAYARMRVSYYVVWDPDRELSAVELSGFEVRGDLYVLLSVPLAFPTLGLELKPWEGMFEGAAARWLRWHVGGVPIPTGAERANAEQARADRLAARLAALGVTDLE